ncbi:uncharacterized protein TNCV_3083041 [Trichonephila clavipes]|nr:uncharacterized protein TNCV_3083041 [Trichonephila clavipes]
MHVTAYRGGQNGPLFGTTKSFTCQILLDSPITISPHKTLNSCRGVISESDLLTTPDAEILDRFSDQGVIQVRRITIKKDNLVIPTKHLILTFNRPKLPTTIKAGYLNCKIRPYIPNPLRCLKCQRFGHSQNSCRGQLTCSRCAAVGHSSTDCTLEPKCINCSQIHTADSKLCPKWKTEKEIQAIKTNNNITYVEARKLIVPQTSHTYAQAAKSSNKTSSTQTDEIITKIKCPPLELLQPLSSTIRKNLSISTPDVSTSSSSTKLNSCRPPLQYPLVTLSLNHLFLHVLMLLPRIWSPLLNHLPQSYQLPHHSPLFHHPLILIPYRMPRNSQKHDRGKEKRITEKMKEAIIDIKMNPHRPKKPASDESTTDEEEMIVYDVEDEIESNPDYVKENGKTYYKGQLLLTPTKHRK